MNGAANPRQSKAAPPTGGPETAPSARAAATHAKTSPSSRSGTERIASEAAAVSVRPHARPCSSRTARHAAANGTAVDMRSTRQKAAVNSACASVARRSAPKAPRRSSA